MAARAKRWRRASGALSLCVAFAACSGPEPTTEPRPPDAVPGRLVGVPEVVDGGTLSVDGRTVRLWGIRAPARSEMCVDVNGSEWPCGEQAAAALADWTGARSVNCDPRSRRADEPIVAVCRLNGRDVGKRMVMQGWAFDQPVQSRRMYQTLERAAASKGRGLHRDASPATKPVR